MYFCRTALLLSSQIYTITNKMEQNTTAPPTLRDVYERLGPRNQAVNDTLNLLKGRGIKVSKNGIYQTIEGRSNRREVVEAFLETAEAELQRRKDVQERINQLATAE